VRSRDAQMTTVALRGLFREKASLVEEFHQAVPKTE
jgi:GTP cyclohydrolase I